MLQKIISGGQTGVDRAALDYAMEHGIPHGGFCPKGRKAEGGRIPESYQLTETESADYAVRTRMNVAHADGTLILYQGELRGGTGLTAKLCRMKGIPLFLLDLNHPFDGVAFKTWLSSHKIHTLNVAGPRESQVPGIYERTKQILEKLFQTAAEDENPLCG